MVSKGKNVMLSDFAKMRPTASPLTLLLAKFFGKKTVHTDVTPIGVTEITIHSWLGRNYVTRERHQPFGDGVTPGGKEILLDFPIKKNDHEIALLSATRAVDKALSSSGSDGAVTAEKAVKAYLETLLDCPLSVLISKE